MVFRRWRTPSGTRPIYLKYFASVGPLRYRLQYASEDRSMNCPGCRFNCGSVSCERRTRCRRSSERDPCVQWGVGSSSGSCRRWKNPAGAGRFLRGPKCVLRGPVSQPGLDPPESSILRRFSGYRGPLTLYYPSFKFPSLSNGGAEVRRLRGFLALSGAFLVH